MFINQLTFDLEFLIALALGATGALALLLASRQYRRTALTTWSALAAFSVLGVMSQLAAAGGMPRPAAVLRGLTDVGLVAVTLHVMVALFFRLVLPAVGLRTARIVEALPRLPSAEIVVNVQGDEPEIAAAAIDAAIELLERCPEAGVATLVDGRVTEFVEKPGPDELIPGEPYRINAGTYVLAPSARGAIPAGQNVSIERDTFPLLADAEPVLHGNVLPRVVMVDRDGRIAWQGAEEMKSLGQLEDLVATLTRMPKMALVATKVHTNAVTEAMVGTGRSWSDADGLLSALGDPECRQAGRERAMG